MVFREAFLQNQRNSEHEWTIDSEGNISGGDLLNRQFVAKKYEQLRRLLEQQGIQAAETRVFSNPWGMQRAAVYIPAIICDGYDIRELSDMLSIHTGMRVGIIRVKFCNQCSRAMMANGNENMCPSCRGMHTPEVPFTRGTGEEVRGIDEDLGKQEPSDIDVQSGYEEGALVREFLENDDLSVTPENMQPDVNEVVRELLQGDSIDVAERDYRERMMAETAPLRQILPSINKTNLVPKIETGIPTHVDNVIEGDEWEGTDKPTVEVKTDPTEPLKQTADTTTEEEGDEKAESTWYPKIISMSELEKTKTEQSKVPIVAGKRVLVVEGPFKELFGDQPAAVKLVNKKRGVATLSLGDGKSTIVVPIGFLREVDKQ